MHLKQALVLTAGLLLTASPAFTAGRPQVAVDFELDDALFDEFGEACRTKVEAAVEACARTQGARECSVGPVSDLKPPAWWSGLPFVDFRGGSNAPVWQLVLRCVDPGATGGGCPMAIHASLDGGTPELLEIFTSNQYTHVLQGCIKQGCKCDQILKKIFEHLPKILDTKRNQLADYFAKQLNIGTVALPDPANTSWVLPVSREELQAGLGTIYHIRHGNTYCRAQDYGAKTDSGYPKEWQGKISSEVLVSTIQPLQGLDEKCRTYLENLPTETLSPLKGLELRIGCFVPPNDRTWEVLRRNENDWGRCQ